MDERTILAIYDMMSEVARHQAEVANLAEQIGQFPNVPPFYDWLAKSAGKRAAAAQGLADWWLNENLK